MNTNRQYPYVNREMIQEVVYEEMCNDSSKSFCMKDNIAYSTVTETSLKHAERESRFVTMRVNLKHVCSHTLAVNSFSLQSFHCFL